MSADTACLTLRLEGPLQSWGTTGRYNRRSTELLPSRSAVMGLICAAMGLERGSAAERDWLDRCTRLRMTAVAVPRLRGDRELAVRRLEDYHVVQDTPKAGGGIKDTHITRRQYLTDATFCVFLTGDRTVLEQAAEALQDPVWGLWLGRKCCIPSAPVFAGLFDTMEEAESQRLPRPLDELFRTEDAPSFTEGEDSVPDMPVSFAVNAREFALRHIVRHLGKRQTS